MYNNFSFDSVPVWVGIYGYQVNGVDQYTIFLVIIIVVIVACTYSQYMLLA